MCSVSNDSIRPISILARFHFSGYNDVSRGGEDQYVSCPATVHRFFHSGITNWPTNLMCCYNLPFIYRPSVLPALLSFFLPLSGDILVLFVAQMSACLLDKFKLESGPL